MNIPKCIVVLKDASSQGNWKKARRFMALFIERRRALEKLPNQVHRSYFDQMLYERAMFHIPDIYWLTNDNLTIEEHVSYLKNAINAIAKSHNLVEIYTFLTESKIPQKHNTNPKFPKFV